MMVARIFDRDYDRPSHLNIEQAGAVDEFAEYLRKSRLFEGKAASVEARGPVRADPKVWQHGKGRADFILCHMAKRLVGHFRRDA